MTRLIMAPRDFEFVILCAIHKIPLVLGKKFLGHKKVEEMIIMRNIYFLEVSIDHPVFAASGVKNPDGVNHSLVL